MEHSIESASQFLRQAERLIHVDQKSKIDKWEQILTAIKMILGPVAVSCEHVNVFSGSIKPKNVLTMRFQQRLCPYLGARETMTISNKNKVAFSSLRQIHVGQSLADFKERHNVLKSAWRMLVQMLVANFVVHKSSMHPEHGELQVADCFNGWLAGSRNRFYVVNFQW